MEVIQIKRTNSDLNGDRGRNHLFCHNQTTEDMLSESPRYNDMVADLHFPRFFRHSHSMWNSTAFSEKCSKSRSQRPMQKYQYFEWGSTLNLDGFKIIIFQYIICEPFRYRKEGLTKLDVNLWEIWQKFKCRRSMSYPLVTTKALSLHVIRSRDIPASRYNNIITNVSCMSK